VSGVSLEVHRGEIVGIAGVDGNGQSELAQAILQLRPTRSGKITVASERQDGDADLRRHISYVPADRRKVGSVASLSIAANSILGTQRAWMRGPFLNHSLVREKAQELVHRFGVRRASLDTTAAQLSGGNLQKLIVGREILRAASVMVVEQPTRGLDVGAIEAIWGELLRERLRGTAILIISAELEELLNLCDRIAVMFNGKIVGIVDGASTSMDELGWMMAGPVVSSDRGTSRCE
jgi:simple sugar transport system ATP-binding protein